METNKISLYEIADAFSKIEELMEDDASLQEYLDSIKMDLVQKVDNIVRYHRSLELTATAIDSEIDRLIHLKKSYANKADKLKDYLSRSLQHLGKPTLETESAKISFRSSTTTEILDRKLIPEGYKKEVVKEIIDKTAIKKAIESGEEVPGAVLVHKQNIQIK